MTNASPTADKTAAATPAASRKKPISHECFQEQSSGLAWCEYLCILPAGWVLDDLKDDSIWKPIQAGSASHKGLCQLDRITICDNEMTWLVEARVAAASQTGASLAIMKRIDLPARTQNLPQSEEWRITYAGRGYVVQNKRTGTTTGQVFFSLAEATNVLYRQTPRAA